MAHNKNERFLKAFKIQGDGARRRSTLLKGEIGVGEGGKTA